MGNSVDKHQSDEGVTAGGHQLTHEANGGAHGENKYTEVVQFSGQRTHKESEWLAELDRKMGIVMECLGVPGMSLAIIWKDKTIVKSYGVTGKNQAPVNADTLFPIGSLTKSFTSALLAKYIALSSTASFETPINSYLTNPIIFSDDERTNEASLIDLCSHRMGLPGHLGCLIAGFDQKLTRTEYVTRIEGMPHTAPFRESFIYQNHMWNVAGYIAERLGGASWEELIKKDIFGPLGMSRSCFIEDTPNVTNFANGWVFQQGQPVEHGTPDFLRTQYMTGPAGSIVASANDMIKWLKFQLSNGRNEDGVQVIPERELLRTREPIVQVEEEEPSIEYDTHYGMGWYYGYYRDSPKLSHSGEIPFSHYALQTLVPEKGIGIVSMTSGQDSMHAQFIAHHFIQDMLIHGDSLMTDEDLIRSRDDDDNDYDEEFAYNNDNYHTQRDMSELHIPIIHILEGGYGETEHLDDYPDGFNPWVEPVFYPQFRPERYVGFYRNPSLGMINIWINPQDGLLQFKYGIATGVLHPTDFPGQLDMNFYGPLWPMTQSDADDELIPVIFYTTDGFDMVAMSTPYFDPDVEMIFEKVG